MKRSIDFATKDKPAIPIYILRPEDLPTLDRIVGDKGANWAKTSNFGGQAGQMLTVPNADGCLMAVLVGDSRSDDAPTERFFLADILQRLGSGSYCLEGDLNQEERDEAALASLFAQYQFDQFTEHKSCMSQLVLPQGCDHKRLCAIAEGECFTRDLINQPASHLGPSELEAHVTDLAAAHEAELRVVKGDHLKEEFPLVYAVGAAGAPPRMLDLRWGPHDGKKLTIIGKGVSFDTGGLNIKPGRSMGLMKKDMGGAAVSMGLTKMIMTMGVDLRLRVLIPAVENAISGKAMRPGDVLNSRAGLTVEVTNTDAEGRLILADAIDYAEEEDPDLLLTLATLTGAARVALGPEIVPYYTENDARAEILEEAARKVRDPLWRLPLWHPYESMLKSDIADCVNATETGFAGSMTAALFLGKFVTHADRWMHFDLYCWQNQHQPGRPRGGIGQASRALFDALPEILDL